MKCFQAIFFNILAVCFLCISASCTESKPLKALIITGQNNHNWELSSAFLEEIMEETKLFDVDIAISPAAGEDMSTFVVEFEPYDVVILDYNGDKWTQETRDNFEQYAKNGGGIVVYHAANNSFPDWDEYSKICALGGWEGRDETSGPYVYLENGTFVKDNSPGEGGSHGREHEYLVNAHNMDHPITKGLPKTWLHAKDELYDRMRGPANIKDFLYTAYSDTATGGSGREEPIVFTVDYGKARIFHTMLGHAGDNAENNPAMQCVGFRTLFLRGAEWAATGRVTQSVPMDFPTSF